MKMKRFLVFISQLYEGGCGLDHLRSSFGSMDEVEFFLSERIGDYDYFVQVLDIEKSVVYEINLGENFSKKFIIHDDGEWSEDKTFSKSILKTIKED